ncbi:MAG: ammonium transporter AmtB-like domain-containing protein [Monoraphidium minutum]|nr:MAG: ammonium transporter AmtB-like domain-containing protein [Monoraphidium minutum]
MPAMEAAPTFCSPTELSALTSVFGDAAAAASFCERLAIAGTADEPMSLSERLDGMQEGTNTFFLTWAGALVFVMHAGFAMLCAGAIRSKNAMNILLQTVLDAAVSAVCFYCIGWAFAYGDVGRGNPFIGDWTFALTDWYTNANPSGGTGRWSEWFFQWAFAATATTIPAGAVAERFNFNAYLAYTILVSSWIYPVVVHWVWSPLGWLSAFNSTAPLLGSGMIDFAGSAVVHMVGGFTGLMGCILVGPRLGRFDSNGKPVNMPGHSATLVVLGTVLLWFGWYGFNPGSTLNIVATTGASNLYLTSGRAAVTTTLSAAMGAIVALLSGVIRTGAWDLVVVCNGALVGLVSVTAGAAVLEPWAALIVGGVGALIFDAACWLWLRFRIDDPLCASQMHGVCGAWGVFATGLLAAPHYVDQAYINGKFGAFYAGGGGNLLACQVIGIVAIFAWTCTLSGALFAVLKAFNKLRISPEEEAAGLDASKHGGSAYNGDQGLVGKDVLRV